MWISVSIVRAMVIMLPDAPRIRDTNKAEISEAMVDAVDEDTGDTVGAVEGTAAMVASSTLLTTTTTTQDPHYDCASWSGVGGGYFEKPGTAGKGQHQCRCHSPSGYM